MAKENIKHWEIGDVQVTRLVELNAFEDDIEMLLPDATPELLKQYEWLHPHFATPDGLMKISFQAFMVKTPSQTVMLDTCIGSDRNREFDVFTNMQSTFLEDLRAAGYDPETVDTVLCTHLHFDHVGWNTHLVNGRWVPTFPNARYLFGRQEWEHWQKMRDEDVAGEHNMEHLKDSIEPVIEAGLAEFIDPDFHVGEELRLVPTPGHTPGHVSLHISSKGENAVITGDLMHHPIQLVEPGRYGNFDMDREQAAQTRRDFIERYRDRKALVIGSHFADPTAGWIIPDGNKHRLIWD